MKIRCLCFLLLFFLFVQHSSEQGFNFSPIRNSGRVTNGNEQANSISSNPGLVTAIRNTTSNIIQRLEAPRDRVIEFIKPAVKSDFTRNVTNVLNSLWNRVQESNISIIQNPIIRNSIVRPINTTLKRLILITAAEDEHDELTDANFEIINLNQPEVSEEQSRDYVASSSNDVIANSLAANDEQINSNNEADKHDEVNNDQLNKEQQVNDDKSTVAVSNEQLNENKPIENEQQVESPKAQNDESNAEDNNPAKSVNKKRRAARFMDNYTYVSPNRVRNLFDNVQQNGMQECFALALCESNCRPHLYEPFRNGGQRGGNFFSRLFDRVESLGHQDTDYYLGARRYGQQNYQSDMMDDCSMCHERYNCSHEREYLVNQFSNYY